MVASETRSNGPPVALTHPRNTPQPDAGRTNSVLLYDRAKPHQIPLWQAQVHSRAATEGCREVIASKGALSRDAFTLVAQADAPHSKLDEHALNASYAEYLASFRVKNSALFELLIMWPGVVTPESLDTCGPNTPLDASRDGYKLYEWLVEPALFGSADAQRAIARALARVQVVANDKSLASPLVDGITKEALKRWMKEYLKLARRSANHHKPETNFVDNVVLLLKRLPSIGAEIKMLSATWKQNSKYPVDGDDAIEQIIAACEDLLPTEVALLPIDLNVDRVLAHSWPSLLPRCMPVRSGSFSGCVTVST